MVTGDEVRRAAGRFGLGVPLEVPTPVSRAWSNEVWRVRTAVGTYAVKFFPPDLPGSRLTQLRAGQAFEAQVLRSGLVPMPTPMGTADAWVVEVETTSGPRLVRCHGWVAGTPATLPLDPGSIRAAGRYLGFLHALDLPGGDTSQVPSFDFERWHRAVDAAAVRKLDWAGRLAELTPLVDDLAADLDLLRRERRPMRISHRDYDPKNAVIDATGRLVITDWDYAGPVLPAAELIVAATSFGGTDAEVLEFVHAYREAGGDAPSADRLALSIEAVDLDWLLRNVEACADGDTVPDRDQHLTAEALIASLPTDVATLRAWPDRLADPPASWPFCDESGSPAA